jgi:hypothetical protein
MLSRIKHRRPSSARIAIALASVALFAALGGVALGTSSNGKTVSRARTVIVTPDSTDTRHVLFTIGQASLDYICVTSSGSTKVGVGFTAGPNGAVIAKDAEQPSGGQVLGANESSDPIILTGAPDAEKTSFAIFDEQGGVAATGLAGASLQSASGPCVISAQAVG